MPGAARARCGTGGVVVTGFDSSAAMVGLARRLGDGAALQSGRSGRPAAVSGRRVLKPGGRLIVVGAVSPSALSWPPVR